MALSDEPGDGQADTGTGSGGPPPEPPDGAAPADEPFATEEPALADEAEPDDLVLACGRSVGDLWTHVREGRLDAHEESCPSCQEAAAEFAVLQRATSELGDAGLDVPATLSRQVMAQVRTELRLGRLIPLGHPDEHACVAEAAVAGVLRDAVDTLAGVRARSCRVVPRRSPTGAAVPGPVTIHIDLAVAYGIDIPRTADAVRSRVRGAARAAIGLSIAQVHILAVDLWDEVPAWTGENARYEGERV